MSTVDKFKYVMTLRNRLADALPGCERRYDKLINRFLDRQDVILESKKRFDAGETSKEVLNAGIEKIKNTIKDIVNIVHFMCAIYYIMVNYEEYLVKLGHKICDSGLYDHKTVTELDDIKPGIAERQEQCLYYGDLILGECVQRRKEVLMTGEDELTTKEYVDEVHKQLLGDMMRPESDFLSSDSFSSDYSSDEDDYDSRSSEDEV